MQLTDKIFKGLYRRGVMLEQMKEPALSRTVKQMEPAEPCENPRDIDALSPEEILRAAEEADIVDETDGRPLAEKLREAMDSGTMLLIDAIDDEPYVSSQMGPMLALRDQCAGGIRLAARALGTTDATVLVYRHISDSEVAIPRNIGGIPISLSTSGGALIAGLFFGWLRSKHPTFGRIPEPSQWVLNNVGLNMFIAVVGISAGPSFVQGFHDVGISLFLVGAAATALPLIIGLLLARYVFKFHPALALGVCAGARTTTAALGAVQDAVESETPALGYTVTYAVGNTLLIIWGVVIVLLI